MKLTTGKVALLLQNRKDEATEIAGTAFSFIRKSYRLVQRYRDILKMERSLRESAKGVAR
jgi:hypothetical protein